MAIMVMKSAPLSDRARTATEAARRLLPQWTAFARMLARKRDLKVVLTGGTPRTDGETVWLRVPIELGDEVPHEKSVCGKRHPETVAMLCPACRVLDSVNTTIFHEMAHIIHGSFEEVAEADRLRIIDEAVRLECEGVATGTRAAKLARRIESAPEWQKRSWIGVANLVSPFLPMLLNAVEDVWVNAEMMGARPGTKTMFSAQTTDVFENGIETDAGIVKWNEQPLNAQAIIGVYCKGSSLPYTGWLDPKVVEDLNDREIISLCHRITSSRTAKARYQLAIKLLEALRRLGYLLSEDDPEDDPEPDPGEGEPDDEGESSPESDGEEGSPSGGDKKSESESDEGDEGDDESSSGGSGSEADDEGTDDTEDGGDDADDDAEGDDADEAEGLTTTGKAADPESGDSDDAGKGADKAEFGDEADSSGSTDEGSIVEGEAGTASPSSESEIETEEQPEMGDPEEVEDLFKTFGRHDKDDEPETVEEREEGEAIDVAITQGEHFDKESRLTGLNVYRADDGSMHRAYRAGTRTLPPTPETILAPSLTKLRTIFAENRKGKYERNLKSGRRLDTSSMSRRIPTGDPRIFKRRSLPGKRDYFVVIGLDISGSTSGYLVELIKEAGMAQAELLSRLRIPFALYCHSGERSEVTIFEIKGPNEPWNERTKEALSRIGAFAANLDGHTLEFYRKRAEEHRATDKIIMYYTDGAMPCENYNEELDVLQRNIKICEEQGTTLVAVGVRNDDPKRHGLDTIRLDRIEDVPKVVEELGKRLV